MMLTPAELKLPSVPTPVVLPLTPVTLIGPSTVEIEPPLSRPYDAAWLDVTFPAVAVMVIEAAFGAPPVEAMLAEAADRKTPSVSTLPAPIVSPPTPLIDISPETDVIVP